jgi:hypothetical protein
MKHEHSRRLRLYSPGIVALARLPATLGPQAMTGKGIGQLKAFLHTLSGPPAVKAELLQESHPDTCPEVYALIRAA